jgi:hypothetical protein
VKSLPLSRRPRVEDEQGEELGDGTKVVPRPDKVRRGGRGGDVTDRSG